MVSWFGGGGHKATAKAIDRSQAMVAFKPNGVILRGNERFLSAMGYTIAEVRGQHHSMFMPLEERDTPAYRAFWEALRRGEFQAADFRRIGKGGREVWLQATYTPILGLGGRVTRVIKFASDLTAAKLQSVDDKQQIAAINRAQGVIEFALDGTILDANPNFLSAMGYTLAEVRGQHHAMFMPPGARDDPGYRAFWEALRRGDYQRGEFQRVGKGGREVWIQASYNPMLDPAGRTVKVVKFAIDITAAKQRSADHAGQMTAINRAQAVVEFGLDGTILAANDNFLAVMGYTLEEIEGKHHSIFMPQSDRESPTYRAFWDALRRGEFQAGEFHRVGRDGRDVWIQASYNPVLDAARRVIKVVKFATDITAEVERREIFAILSLVANETDNSVLIAGPDGLVEYVNPGFTRLTGYTKDEVIGHKPGKVLQVPHTDPAAVRRIRESLQRDVPLYEES